MYWRFGTALVVLLAFLDGAFAGTLKVPAGQVKRLTVSGFLGKVRVVGEARPDYLVSWDFKSGGGSFQVSPTVINEVLDISITGGESKDDYQNLPRLDVVIKGPAVPTEVVWKEGGVHLLKLEKGGTVALIKGDVTLDESGDSFRVTVQEGKVVVNGHKGALDIDVLSANTVLKSVVGPMNIRNFSGTLDANGLDGPIQLVSVQGKNDLENSKGSLELQGGLGRVNLMDFEGSVDGGMEQGTLTAKLKGAVSFRVHTTNGHVRLSVPKSSGAWVNLGTEDGIMVAEGSLKPERTAGMKYRRGRLGGREEGVIRVRTKAGNIKLNSY